MEDDDNDDIFETLDELLSIATTEEEIQIVMELYDEYTGREVDQMIDDTDYLPVESLLEIAETEEEIQEVIDAYDLGNAEVVEDAGDFALLEDEEDDPKPASEESSWELGEFDKGWDDGDWSDNRWADRDGEIHIIHKEEPSDPNYEFRIHYDYAEDALAYINDIGAGGGYFDVFESGSGFDVYYTGGLV